MIGKEFIRKHAVNFSKFTIIGIITSLLNIVCVWFLIDVMYVKTVIASSMVVGSIFVLKFYMYVLIKLIRKQFLKYTIIQVISALINIFLTWLFIDVFGIQTIYAVSMVVVVLFLGRYTLFNVTKLIEN